MDKDDFWKVMGPGSPTVRELAGGGKAKVKRKFIDTAAKYRELWFPQLEALGLPLPHQELCFHPSRKWKLDFAWPIPYKLALEVEGGIWMRKGAHNTGVAILRDIEKYNELALEGWVLLRVTPEMLDWTDSAGGLSPGPAALLIERALK